MAQLRFVGPPDSTALFFAGWQLDPAERGTEEASVAVSEVSGSCCLDWPGLGKGGGQENQECVEPQRARGGWRSRPPAFAPGRGHGCHGGLTKATNLAVLHRAFTAVVAVGAQWWPATAGKSTAMFYSFIALLPLANASLPVSLLLIQERSYSWNVCLKHPSSQTVAFFLASRLEGTQNVLLLVELLERPASHSAWVC